MMKRAACVIIYISIMISTYQVAVIESPSAHTRNMYRRHANILKNRLTILMRKPEKHLQLTDHVVRSI